MILKAGRNLGLSASAPGYTKGCKITIKTARKAIGKQMIYLQRELDAAGGKLTDRMSGYDSLHL